MLNFSATRISGSEHFPAFFRAVSHLRLVLMSRQEFSELLQHPPLPRPVIVANGSVFFQTFQSLSKIVEATEKFYAAWPDSIGEDRSSLKTLSPPHQTKYREKFRNFGERWGFCGSGPQIWETLLRLIMFRNGLLSN